MYTKLFLRCFNNGPFFINHVTNVLPEVVPYHKSSHINVVYTLYNNQNPFCSLAQMEYVIWLVFTANSYL